MKNNRVFTIAFILLLCFAIFDNSYCQDTVRVTDFGVQPGSRMNAVPGVQKAVEVCNTKKHAVLVFPKDRYDFWPQYAIEKLYYESNSDVIPLRRCAILLEKISNLTIDACGSDFIFHDRIQPFTIDNCNNIKIKNVAIDWDVPLSAQARVVAVRDNSIDIEINILESPYVIENGKINFVGEGWKSAWWGVMEFDSTTHLIIPNTADYPIGDHWWDYTATELKAGLVRLNYSFVRKPAVGNYLVMRQSAREHAGIFVTDSKNISIERLNMYQNGGLGILSQYSENLFFRKVNSEPNAAKNRYFSGHDDGFHFSNCKGQILVDSCRFSALMDDPINVHGTSVRIIEKMDAHTLLCKFMHHQSIGFTWARVGDSIGFIENETMSTFAKGIVASFTTISPETFEVKFRDAVPEGLQAGNACENLSWTPDVHIQNSFFGSNRARGILISTPGKVIIENNVFESSGSAILIAGDANQWYESGAVHDVLIRNNVFNDACLTSMYQFCNAIISICPEIPKPDANKPFHRNIRIENNVFHPFDFPVLYAKSTDGISFTGNKLIRSTRYKAFHESKYTFLFEFCKAIKIKDNTMEGDILGRNIKLVSTSMQELLLGKKQGFSVEK